MSGVGKGRSGEDPTIWRAEYCLPSQLRVENRPTCVLTSPNVNTSDIGVGGRWRDDADSELVDRAKAEDRGAFEQLYHRHFRQIGIQMLRMTHASPDLEELTQEVFCQALQGLPGFRHGSRFATWLFRVAANVALQCLRRRRRRGGDVPYEDAKYSHQPLRADGTKDPEEVASNRELCRALKEAVGLLPANQRAVAVLGPIQGHSYGEMAQILGVTVGMVKGRLHRALSRLRALLGPFRPRTSSTALPPWFQNATLPGVLDR